MDVVNQALHSVGVGIAALIAFLIGVFAAIENVVRNVLVQAGVPSNLLQVVLLAVAVVLLVVILRLFGGLLRLLVALFLILLVLHILVPSLGQ